MKFTKKEAKDAPMGVCSCGRRPLTLYRFKGPAGDRSEKSVNKNEPYCSEECFQAFTSLH